MDYYNSIMGLFPTFPICEEILNRAQSFYSTVLNHRVTQQLLPHLLFVNYYIQTTYEYLRGTAVELYYTYINTEYENLRVYNFNKFNNEINCLYYSNHRLEKYLTLKSNSQSFEKCTLKNQDTRDFIANCINIRNPILSAIITIKSKEGDFETSFEVNKLLEPFLFTDNTILGSPSLVFYLIHKNVEHSIKRDDVKKSAMELCDAFQNGKELKDYNIDMSYMSLSDIGIVTIPNIQERTWSLYVTEDNELVLELNDNE